MSSPPPRPKIYHITHVDNVPSIIDSDELISDASMLRGGASAVLIGMSSIKRRRLTELRVDCHPGDYVGEYVPFYFCPRSVMLYLLHRGNRPEITYKDGQSPIIHIEADLYSTVSWANEQGRRWAISLSNAGARYTQFRDELGSLNEIDWDAVVSEDFSTPEVKHAKQAEFLMYGSFPWKLVDRIGVHSDRIAQQAGRLVSASTHRPTVEIMQNWYF